MWESEAPSIGSAPRASPAAAAGTVGLPDRPRADSVPLVPVPPDRRGDEQDDLAHQAADDALLAIVGKLDRFRGESRFTTWAYKFVMLEVSAKLGRHYWRNPPVPMSGDAWERIPDRLGADPAEHAESRELAAALRQAVTEVLSERQRQVFIAIVIDEVPLDALAFELGSTRNALYKVMFDARRKIRAHLVAHGYLDAEGGMP